MSLSVSYTEITPNPLSNLAVTAFTFYIAPVLVDLVGDSRADLVIRGGFGPLQLFENTDAGFTLVDGNLFDVTGQGFGSTAAFTDLDADGDLDAVFLGGYGGMQGFENVAGSFVPMATNPFANLFGYVRTIGAFIDVDEDGDADLLTGADMMGLSAYENSGAGFDDGFPSLFDGLFYNIPGSLAVSDLNGDGKRDLALLMIDHVTYALTLVAFEVTGGSLVPFDINPFADLPVEQYSVPSFGDIDGDGDDDLLLTYDTGEMRVFERDGSPVVNAAPVMATLAGAGFAENGTGAVVAPLATDADGDTLAWSLSGIDAALFDIDGATGEVTFKEAPDFETPADAGGDNTYDLVVTVSDGTATDSEQLSVTVTDVAQEPAIGSALADSLVGGALADTIEGLGGDDTLDGGAGADVLRGGAGDDVHVVDDAGDVVTELAGEGTDLVYASVDWVLGDHVEGLRLAARAVHGTGNGLGNQLTGSQRANHLSGLEGDDTLVGGGGADTLDGGLGDDRLDGGAGNDSMTGGAGDDRYYVDSSGDVVVEQAGQGQDRVLASSSFVLGTDVEMLQLIGGTAADGRGNASQNRIVGNDAANLLEGMAGNDVLVGGSGDDTLTGGEGIDRLEGGAGADVFRFLVAGEGADRIVGFTPGADVVEISALGFGGGLVAGEGLDAATQFVSDLLGRPVGFAAQFIYQETTGRLFWDADGRGAETRVLLATFDGHPALQASDIVLI
ncbi:hypothetical protein [Falsiroseomonas sp. CW058]|uniref:calcium-binding protein n=1 Tax=Falsiroseomonas sp. CW058 TaxID=3388664 RepID=UPI003D322F39